MVQVLSANPSFAQQFGRQFGKNVGSAGVGALEGLQEKREDEAIKRLTGKDLSGLSPEFKKVFTEKLAKSPEHERIAKAFESYGFSPEEAEFYSILTQGGQTAVVKDLLEGKKRAGAFGQKLQRPPSPQQVPGAAQEEASQSLSPEDVINEQIKEMAQEQDAGLTPAEKVTRSNKRYDENLKEYQDTSKRLRGLSDDKSRLGILEKLNESKKLPKDLGRLNVNKEGNLRLPFLASPEAQRYVKTLNEFSTGAKDTFGSRVTNFDLQQYLLRYPNLLNSEEGRRQLLQQMKIVNQLNSMYYKNLKNVYDRAGGVRNIDSDVALRLAEEITEPKANELIQKFNQIGTFPSLPNASEFKGRKMINDETGEIMMSNGSEWVPAG